MRICTRGTGEPALRLRKGTPGRSDTARPAIAPPAFTTATVACTPLPDRAFLPDRQPSGPMERLTRYSPPHIPGQFHRASLDRRLEQVRSSRLTLVEAPPGYGKTSALIQWFETLREAGGEPRWLTLATSDNDPATLAQSLLDALLPGAGIAIGSASEVMGRTDPDTLISALREKLNRLSGKQVYLFIDDADTLSDPDAAELLGAMLAEGPVPSHTILAGRSLHHFPATRHRLAADVAAFDADDLKFDVEEAVAFFATDREQQWSRKYVADLVAQTDGWMMALLAIKHRAARDRPVDPGHLLFATSAELQDYLSGEILDRLDEDARNFLLDISILEEVNGDLANELRERGDGWGLLERLHRQNLFVFSADDSRYWFRLHALFREALSLRLRRERDAEDVQRLHERAGRWFAAKGQHDKALRHLAQAECGDAAAKLLDDLGGWRLVLRDGATLLRVAQEAFPEDFFRQAPSLLMSLIYTELKAGNTGRARQLFEDMERRSAGFANWPEKPAQPPFADEALIMDVYIASYENAFVPTAKLERLRALQPSVASEDRSLGAFIDTLLAFQLIQSTDFTGALRAGERALRYFLAQKAKYSAAFMRLHASRALFAIGRLTESENELLICHDMAADIAGPEARLAAISSLFQAQIAYERNDFESASAKLEESEPFSLETDNWYDSFETYFSVKSSIAASQGDLALVTEVLDAAEETAIYRNLPSLATRMNLRKLRNLLVFGQADRAGELFRRLETEWDCTIEEAIELARFLHAARLVGECRFRIATGEADRVMAVLTPAIARAGELQWFMIEAKLKVLATTALWRGGSREEALSLLDEVVTESLFEDIRRTFIDEAFLLQPVLNAAAERVEGYRTNRLKDARINELRTQCRSELARLGKANANRQGLLTAKESEIVPLLSQGFSNKEIAIRLDVTENAIKYHLKNIFAKLDVHSRQDAILALKNANII